jgi:hypothetical protein
MACVWAFQEGVFRVNTATGWSHSIKFGEPQGRVAADGTRDLIEKLATAGLAGAVERLAIVVHGIPGRVYMSGRQQQPATVDQLRDLSTYLKPGGMLSFVSCNAGEGPSGDLFLMALSRALPSRVVVAQSVSGIYSNYGVSDPGNVTASKDGSSSKPGAPRIDPWGDYAKWAFGGAIVRCPANEQKHYKHKHCANPQCRGHVSELHRCPYASWGKDPTLLAYAP